MPFNIPLHISRENTPTKEKNFKTGHMTDTNTIESTQDSKSLMI